MSHSCDEKYENENAGCLCTWFRKVINKSLRNFFITKKEIEIDSLLDSRSELLNYFSFHAIVHEDVQNEWLIRRFDMAL